MKFPVSGKFNFGMMSKNQDTGFEFKHNLFHLLYIYFKNKKLKYTCKQIFSCQTQINC